MNTYKKVHEAPFKPLKQTKKHQFKRYADIQQINKAKPGK